MKLFELNIFKGTFKDGINKTFAVNSGFVYHRGDKGLALNGESGDDIIFSQTLTGIKTIMLSVKKTDDTTLIKDNATTKIEITGGNISGTNLTQCYIDNVDTDTVGDGYKLVIAEFSAGIDFSTNIKIAPSSDIYLAHKIVFYDELLSTSERAAEFSNFLMASPKITEKYPRFLPEHKSTSLNESGLVAAYNMIPSTGGVLTDISGNGNNGTINGAISSIDGLVFDGIDDEIVLSNVIIDLTGNNASFLFRYKQNETGVIFGLIGRSGVAFSLLEVNSGTLVFESNTNGDIVTAVYVEDINVHDLVVSVDSGTVQFYLDGVPMTMTDNTVTNDITINRIGACRAASFAKGEIQDFKIYNYAFTANQVAQYHNSFIRNVLGKFPDDYDGVGNTPNGIKVNSGTFTTQELTSQDSVLKELDIGTKYTSCDGSGVISVSNKHAQGTYEFYINKADASDFLFNFIMSKSDGQGNGYAVRIDTNEAISGNEVLGGVLTSKFATANSYVSHSTWYKIKVTVNNSGEVATFIKGGALGNQYVLVGIFTDITYTTSSYIVASCGTGDKLIIE